MENTFQTYNKQFVEKKCCVLIPTYNNAQVLENVILDVLQFTTNIIVINDGATDNTLEILAKYSDIEFVSYTPNQGKGNALQKGFAYARKQGYEYAISIDSDGQHFAEDLPKFLEKLESHDNAIIIGARNMEGANQKESSGFANKFSNFWFWAETGVKHPDTQSGYRLYPIKKFSKMRFFTKRYEFEIEVIVRAVWRGIDVTHVPIKVFYPNEDERITHFRPFKDFFRISVLNTILVIFALLYGFPAKIYHNLKKKGLRKHLKESILQSNDSNLRLSIAIGFGVFMGIIPIWGWQLATAIALAYVFKLNRPLVIIAANISVPPMIPFLLFASFYIGSLILGNDFEIHLSSDINFETIKNDLFQYIIGSTVFAILAGILSTAISYVLIKTFRNKK